MNLWMKKFYVDFRMTYHLEFNTFLYFLSLTIFTSASYPLFYVKVCQNLYPKSNDTSHIYICDDFDGIQSDIEIQKSSTNWMMYLELARFLSEIFGTMFLASFGDRYGRKIPMLISVTASAVFLYLFLVIITVYSIPLYCMAIMSAFTSLGGQWVVFMSCEFGEVADYVTDKSKLTVRYAILTSFLAAANVVGGNVAPFLLTYLGFHWTTFVGFAIMVTTFFSVLLLFPNKVSTVSEIKLVAIQSVDVCDKAIMAVTPNDLVAVRNEQETFGWLKEGLGLYKSAWRTIKTKRLNHGRIYLLIYCIVGMIYTSKDCGLEGITVLYIYHTPLLWSPQLYAWWFAAMNFSQMIGSVICAIIFKKVGMSDTMILMVSTLSGMVKMIGIGIGRKTWVMFASLGFGCLSTVGFSALRSLVTQLGSPKESGELLSVINLSLEWCVVFSAVVFNNMYTATLTIYIGLPWLFEAFLLILCIFAVLIVHIQTRNQSIYVKSIETAKIEKF